MDWQQRMTCALNYLELNLKGDLDFELAAREANCSFFHFMRMFEVIVGIGPGEYVRRRRLSCAALELASENGRILDIALRYGYDSPDSFTRAFKREFGCLPSEARRPGTVLHAYPPLAFSIALKGDKAMEYRIEKSEGFSLTGLSIPVLTEDGSNFKNIPAFWDELHRDGRLARLHEKAEGPGLGVLGVCHSFDVKACTFTYSIAIETPVDRTGLPEGCAEIEVPPSVFAKFTSRGPLRPTFQETIKRAYSEWFPASGREHAGTVEIEYYGTHPDPTAADYWCEYWIPLK